MMPAASIRSIAGPTSPKGPVGSRLQLLTMLSRDESRKVGLIMTVQKCCRKSSLATMCLPQPPCRKKRGFEICDLDRAGEPKTHQELGQVGQRKRRTDACGSMI